MLYYYTIREIERPNSGLGCPDANPVVLHDLCVELAPYLRSASMDHRMEERSCLTWELVRLHPDAALFTLTDSAAGSAAYGPYDTSTRDGLVRVEKAGHHVGTVKQLRFGLLSAACRKRYRMRCCMRYRI